MMNRRDFCLRGAALSAGAGGLLAAGGWPGAMDFDKVIFDTRFAASRAWAAAVRGPLGERAGVAGDITRLWFEQLSPRWRAGRILLAGMTTPATLFCLEQLAKDHWQRVVLRIEHHESIAGPVHHRVSGDGHSVVRAARHLERARSWPGAAAAAVASFDRRPHDNTARQLMRVSPSLRASAPSTLVSWIIA
jgi:hypothetical protein